MFDLLDLVETRFVSIMGSIIFDKPLGGTGTITVLQLGVQSRKAAIGDEEYPFVLARLKGGSDKPSNSTVVVELVAGLYVKPDRDGDGDVDGDDDLITPAKAAMAAIIAGFRSLATDGNYSPYSFESMSYRIGDKDGLQPGPDYYQMTAELEFSLAPIF